MNLRISMDSQVNYLLARIEALEKENKRLRGIETIEVNLEPKDPVFSRPIKDSQWMGKFKRNLNN